MTNARNLGDIGARLQKTTNTELSAGGNIRATTFQGSGRLLTDLFTLTGGNIVIPIGSTRAYKNFSTAFYSMSSFLLNQTGTSVTFVVDPETIVETAPITLNHPDGEFMTLSGSFQPGFIAKATSPGTNSPVTSVAFTTGGALSATLSFDNTLTNPQPGDYINIWSVSGAEARQIVNPTIADASGNPILYSGTVPLTEYGTLGFLTSGSPVIYYRQASSTSWPSFSARIVSVDRVDSTDVKYTLGGVADTSGATSLAGFAGSARWFMDTGTPESFKGNRITSITLNNVLSASTLTFSDARATNTYLNAGDLILVLGQVFPVIAVGGSNTCVIQGCIRLPTSTGWNRTASVPAGGYYYLVNSRIDYYIGAHRVVARPTANTVTIEIAQNVCVDRESATNGTGRTLFPPPLHGISQIGLSTAGTNDGVIKSIIRYVPPTAAAAQRSEFLNIFGHTFAEIKQIAFESTRPLLSSSTSSIYAGLRLGKNLSETVNVPASITLTNVVFQSFFPAAISLYNNSTINLNRVTINSGLSSSQTIAGLSQGDSYAIACFNSIVQANRLAINGNGPAIYVGDGTAGFNYLYCKNNGYYWAIIDGSNATFRNTIFNNCGHPSKGDGYSSFSYGYAVRGISPTESSLSLETVTMIGGMHQLWLIQSQQLISVFSRCCFWEMPNPDGGSYGLAFYNGGTMQNYYIYHMGNSLVDGGSYNFWMDQDSNCVYGFCVAVGTGYAWVLQDNSDWVEYNSSSSFRNNVAMFCENGLYNQNNVSFRANVHSFLNTTYPIFYTGNLISGISTNTNVVGATTSITGVTQNIAPDANGNYLRYT